MEIKDFIRDEPEHGVFRVHRSAMTSPEIMELERERIFDKVWQYVGHESEVPNPGDFCRRDVAGRPLFFVRGSDGQVRVFFNTCLHRGALICREDEGNADALQCFYHAWTYNNLGELIGIPDRSGYSTTFDFGERALQCPPRVEDYRGFYFASFESDVENLASYLGNGRVVFDLMTEQSPAGIKVLPGIIKYSIRANWKLMIENTVDSYHVPTTHATWLQYLDGIRRPMVRSEASSWGIELGHGHAGFGDYPGVRTDQYHVSPERFSQDLKTRIAEIRDYFAARDGSRLANWSPTNAFNSVIFPNLLIVGNANLRRIWPVSPDVMEVTWWVFVPKDLEGDALAKFIRGFPGFQGPGGFASPDDLEALESCQNGFAAREVEWSDISRGMHRVPQKNDELQMRAFWRQWHASMLGLTKVPNAYDWDTSEQRERVVARSGR